MPQLYFETEWLIATPSPAVKGSVIHRNLAGERVPFGRYDEIFNTEHPRLEDLLRWFSLLQIHEQTALLPRICEAMGLQADSLFQTFFPEQWQRVENGSVFFFLNTFFLGAWDRAGVHVLQSPTSEYVPRYEWKLVRSDPGKPLSHASRQKLGNFPLELHAPYIQGVEHDPTLLAACRKGGFNHPYPQWFSAVELRKTYLEDDDGLEPEIKPRRRLEECFAPGLVTRLLSDWKKTCQVLKKGAEGTVCITPLTPARVLSDPSLSALAFAHEPQLKPLLKALLSSPEEASQLHARLLAEEF